MDAELKMELLSRKEVYEFFLSDLEGRAEKCVEETIAQRLAEGIATTEPARQALMDQKVRELKEKFWCDQDERILREMEWGREEQTTIEQQQVELFEVLKPWRCFPDDSHDYSVLCNHGAAIGRRAMMVHVPHKEMQILDLLDRRKGGHGVANQDVETPTHAVYTHLEAFAQTLGLPSPHVLLGEITFTAELHAWVQAHNRIRRGKALVEDKAMVESLLKTAKLLLPKSKDLKGGHAKTPGYLVHAVLTAVCAMQARSMGGTKEWGAERKIDCGASTRDGRALQLVKWEVKPLLPDFAEKTILPLKRPDFGWERVPASEWLAYHTQVYNEVVEEESRARARRECDEDMRDVEDGGQDEPAPPPPMPPPLRRFDPYKIKESYDKARLDATTADLTSDEPARQAAKQSIMERLASRRPTLGDRHEEVKRLERWHKALLRCDGLHQCLAHMERATRGSEVDGLVSQLVQYKTLGAVDGRQYAQSTVSIPNEDGGPPRTPTLAAMCSDARGRLVGSIAYDIDSKNSDPHLLLGIIEDAGLEHVAPRVRDYVESRKAWIAKIVRVHGVNECTAKRLPNRVMNGGRYRSWLVDNGLPWDGPKVREIVELQEQMLKLRAAIFKHAKYEAYVASERERVERKKSKKTDDEVDRSIQSSIVQRAENAMLQAAMRAFFDAGWDILAAIFDGFIGSPATDDALPLDQAIARAEAACRGNPVLKYVEFTDKPLYGTQDDPIKTITNARDAVRAFNESVAA